MTDLLVDTLAFLENIQKGMDRDEFIKLDNAVGITTLIKRVEDAIYDRVIPSVQDGHPVVTGDQARTIREDLGWSLAEMATALGFTASQQKHLRCRMMDIENGFRKISPACARLLLAYQQNLKPWKKNYNE